MLNGGNGNGVYFRVSSANFNWFDIIWTICYKNKNWISDVTIVADLQSNKRIKSENYFYNLNGPVDRIPLEDFLYLKGNPIIESAQDIDSQIIQGGGSLLEVFGDYGPYHNHRKFEAWFQNYLIEKFIWEGKGESKW